MEVVAYWQNIRYITLGRSILTAMRLLCEGKLPQYACSLLRSTQNVV